VKGEGSLARLSDGGTKKNESDIVTANGGKDSVPIGTKSDTRETRSRIRGSEV